MLKTIYKYDSKSRSFQLDMCHGLPWQVFHGCSGHWMCTRLLGPSGREHSGPMALSGGPDACAGKAFLQKNVFGT